MRARAVSCTERLLMLMACTALAAALTCPLAAQERFPHAAHQGLFPVCVGCHAGAGYTDRDPLYPDAALCANCHDGAARKRVRWTAPVEIRSTFPHVAHTDATRVTGKSLDCSDCHVKPGTGRMDVVALNLGVGCKECHSVHKAGSSCEMCHSATPPPHQRNAHAGCDSCHEKVHLDALPATRSFCLVCHRDLTPHHPTRVCVDCHQLGRINSARL